MYLAIMTLPLVIVLVALTGGRKLGNEGIGIYTVGGMIGTFVMGWNIFKEVVIEQGTTYVKLWNWVMVEIGFQYDTLTGIMVVVVTGISLLVHLYSLEYMKEDPHQGRFMIYLTMFTWFMLILITANNLMQLFVGWEGVGLCSYLLINYWYTRVQANKSAMQAMIVNRVGDVGVVMAIIISYWAFGGLEYAVMMPMGELGGWESEVIGFWILVGAVGKSAQIGLHVWLPNAMEAPTPVSALIHAATMVTAGVFIMLRTSPIIGTSEKLMTTIAVVGAMTAFFAATVGLVQNDIKKVIAYSTCSQLGYMVLAIGVGANTSSIFHLFNHAFFKALLFLSAGSIIHAIADEQDIRKMGGLITRQPYTYSLMLVGSMSLMGFPFMTGFYSKDSIIEMAYGSYSIAGTFGHWLGCISALMTAFYSVRILTKGFNQEVELDKKTFEKAHEPGQPMTITLIILGVASIYIGYVMKDLMIGPGVENVELIAKEGQHGIESEFIEGWVKVIPVVLSLGGAGYGLVAYPRTGKGINKKAYTFISNKWNVDQLYNEIIAKNALKIGHNITYKVLDRGLIEKLGPTGIIETVGSWADRVSKGQTGQLYHYSLTIIIGTIVMIVLETN